MVLAPKSFRVIKEVSRTDMDRMERELKSGASERPAVSHVESAHEGATMAAEGTIIYNGRIVDDSNDRKIWIKF